MSGPLGSRRVRSLTLNNIVCVFQEAIDYRLNLVNLSLLVEDVYVKYRHTSELRSNSFSSPQVTYRIYRGWCRECPVRILDIPAIFALDLPRACKLRLCESPLYWTRPRHLFRTQGIRYNNQQFHVVNEGLGKDKQLWNGLSRLGLSAIWTWANVVSGVVGDECVWRDDSGSAVVGKHGL